MIKFKPFKNYTGEDVLKFVLLLSLLLLFTAFLIMPLLILFCKAFQDGDGAFVGLRQFQVYFTSPNMLSSLLNTIFISVISTVIAVSLASVFAYCITRRNVMFKKPMQFIAMLPIFSPTMLLGMSLIYLFGNKGLITQIGFKLPLYGELGIIIAESVYCFPVALMIMAVAFSAADNRLYEAADAMDTGSFRKMLTITLPGVKYGLISSVFICFTYSFTDFGAPSVVGGNYNVLATDIYKQVIGQQNFNMGAVVGIFMMIPTIISFIVDRITSGKQASGISSKSVPYQIKPNRKADVAATVFCSIITAVMVLYFGVSLFGSLVTLWPYNLNLTLGHYDFSKIASGAGVECLKNSLGVSAMVALIGTAVTFTTAYLVEKSKALPRLRQFIYFMAITPMAVPGTVIGLSFILFFNPLTLKVPFTGMELSNIFSGLYGTFSILIIVNIIHYFSVPFITALTALKRLDKEFETVSESLRVPLYKTFFRITVPLSFSAILEMCAYFFMNSMITVSAVVFLYTPATQLASVVILNVHGAGDDAEAAALCMVILGINIVVRLVYEVVQKRVSKKTDAWIKR